MSDSPVSPAETKTRQQLRAERRQRAREATQDVIEPDEPEIPPTLCAWCGFTAYFEDEATEAEKAKCPACSTVYDDASASSPAYTGDSEQMDQVRRDAVHRRIANALDSIFGLLEEQWQVQSEAMGRRY